MSLLCNYFVRFIPPVPQHLRYEFEEAESHGTTPKATFPSFKCIYIFSLVLLFSGIVEHIICPGHARPPPLKATCCFCSCAIWATCWRKHVKNVSVRLSCPGRGGSGPTRHPHVVADCGVRRGALLRAAVGRLRVRICPTIPPVFLAPLLAART